MMMLLPLFFVIFIIRFPAGLLVYWITTNAWTMGQQYVIRKRIGPITPLVAAEPPSTDGRDGRDGRASTGGTNGLGSGGLAGLLRGRSKPEDQQPAGVGAGSRPRRETPPPRPPRKKKKRSGRRR